MDAQPNNTTVAPVYKRRELECSAEHAWTAFTAQIGTWWPTATHAISDDVVDVVFEAKVGGSIHEVRGDGSTAAWGKVLVADHPSRLVWAWHLSRAETTEVEVTFTPHGNGCTLELVHRNWEAWGDEAADRRGEYEHGWDMVLDGYQSSAIASSSSASSAS